MRQPYPAGDPLGRVYTDADFALAVCQAARTSREGAQVRQPWNVLDPSVGGGHLLHAARRVWPAHGVTTLGVDIDPKAAGFADCAAHHIGDWTTIARFWNRLPLAEHCGDGKPDLILQNPPFGKKIGVRITIEHVLWATRIADHAMVILPLPYLCGAEFDVVWKERRPSTIHRVVGRPWPDRLREVAVFEWNVWGGETTQILDLDYVPLRGADPPG